MFPEVAFTLLLVEAEVAVRFVGVSESTLWPIVLLFGGIFSLLPLWLPLGLHRENGSRLSLLDFLAVGRAGLMVARAGWPLSGLSSPCTLVGQLKQLNDRVYAIDSHLLMHSGFLDSVPKSCKDLGVIDTRNLAAHPIGCTCAASRLPLDAWHAGQ